MTITVGAFEAKTKLSELLNRVENGEEVVITRRGKEVARMTAVTAAGTAKTPAIRGKLLEIGRKARKAIEAQGIDVAGSDRIDVDRLRRLSDQFVEHFGRPFRSTDIDTLLYDEDGLPR